MKLFQFLVPAEKLKCVCGISLEFWKLNFWSESMITYHARKLMVMFYLLFIFNERSKNDVINTKYIVLSHKLSTKILCRPKSACCALRYIIEITHNRTYIQLLCSQVWIYQQCHWQKSKTIFLCHVFNWSPVHSLYWKHVFTHSNPASTSNWNSRHQI